MLKSIDMPQTRGEVKRLAAGDVAMQPSVVNTPTPKQFAMAQAWFKPIFHEICANCPGWRAAIPDGGADSVAQVWFEALVTRKAALSDTSITRGMRKLQEKRLTWLPHPLDFVDMCLESGAELPSQAEALAEVREKAHAVKFRVIGDPEPSYTHPMIKHLAHKCAGLFLTGVGEISAKEAFAREYKKAVDIAKQGAFNAVENPQLAAKPIDPNLAYYFTLVRDFKHMPSLAEDHLKACADKGIIIDPVAGTVTRPDVSLVADKVVTAKEYRGGDSGEEKVFTSKKDGVNSVGAVVLSGAERELLGLVVKNPLEVSAIYRDVALVLVGKLDGLAAYAGQVKALRNYIAVADLG